MPFKFNDVQDLLNEKKKKAVVQKYKGSPNFCRMFVSLYGLGLLYFIFNVWNRLNEIGIGIKLRMVIISLLFTNIYSFYSASKKDPGYLTKENVETVCKMYNWDGIYYVKKDCYTCNFIKPARSKHCSICNRCIAVYDHHCVWINSCVGLRNYKWFMMFLLTFIVICGWGSSVMFQLLVRNHNMHEVYKMKRFDIRSNSYKNLTDTDTVMPKSKVLSSTDSSVIQNEPTDYFYKPEDASKLSKEKWELAVEEDLINPYRKPSLSNTKMYFSF
ncbi:hypothetical protein BB558_004522 [Smittium angustum]|uniref:Palmitoyltransferase n=1 Tax=Smittium angustum TaxID=133377 RepID=A0A2U1J345_SMIAN|nr:hypothetical protein BB558_004522 [Smittium angustum]